MRDILFRNWIRDWSCDFLWFQDIGRKEGLRWDAELIVSKTEKGFEARMDVDDPGEDGVMFDSFLYPHPIKNTTVRELEKIKKWAQTKIEEIMKPLDKENGINENVHQTNT